MVSLAVAACSPPQREPLTEQEQALVDEVVALYTVQMQRLVHPDSSFSVESLDLTLTPDGIQQQLDQLAADPKRGQYVLEAVHDSLEALRPRLFPMTQGKEAGRGAAREVSSPR